MARALARLLVVAAIALSASAVVADVHRSHRRAATAAARRGHRRPTLARPLLGRRPLAVGRPPPRMGRRALDGIACEPGVDPRPLGESRRGVGLSPGPLGEGRPRARPRLGRGPRPAGLQGGDRAAAARAGLLLGRRPLALGRWDARLGAGNVGNAPSPGGLGSGAVDRPRARLALRRRTLAPHLGHRGERSSDGRPASFLRVEAAATIRLQFSSSSRQAPMRFRPSGGPW